MAGERTMNTQPFKEVSAIFALGFTLASVVVSVFRSPDAMMPALFLVLAYLVWRDSINSPKP